MEFLGLADLALLGPSLASTSPSVGNECGEMQGLLIIIWLVVEPTESEKYARQTGSFPQKTGWNKKVLEPPLKLEMVVNEVKFNTSI